MKCFMHHDQDAVGACKSCGKGLCPHCAVDLGKGLACRQRCEADVEALIALIDHNLLMAGKTTGLLRGSRQIQFGAVGLYCLMGLAFLAWGLLGNPQLLFLCVLGALFLAYGLFSLARLTHMPRVEAQPAKAPE